MDDLELRAVISSELHNAVGFLDDEVTEQRSESLEYYYGELPKAEDEGRSSVVATEVRDTIEWMMPQLMRVFLGGDRICEFVPVGMEDEEAAEQETAAVNHVVLQQNRGFELIHEAVKDALMSKVGYWKVYWSEEEDQSTETYEGLTDAELAMLMQDPELEPVEHASQEVATPEGVMVAHSVRFIRRRMNGGIKVECVPPEDVLVSRRATSIYPNDMPFLAHRERVSKTDLIERGFDEETISRLQKDTDESLTDEEYVRRTLVSSWTETEGGAEDHYWLYECYVKLDYDDDGIAELRKVTVGGSGYEILDNEEIDRIPFAAITPVLQSHQHYGMSVADMTVDLQDVKTSLLRQTLDNLYLSNAPRTEVVTGQVNLDDLLNVRSGGVVRTKAPGMMREISVPFVAQHAYGMLEYFDGLNARRTGYSEVSQGVDPNVLQQATAGAIAAAMSASQSRVEMIARTMAETGIRDLMLQVHELLRKHQTEDMMIKLNGSYAPVNPQTWRERSDMVVSVGLGTGNVQQRLATIQAILNAQQQAVAAGGMNVLVTPSHVYNALSEMVEIAGYRNPGQFFLDPQHAEPMPEGPSDAEKLAEAQAAIEAMKVRQKDAEAAQKAEIEVMKAQLDHIQKMTKIEADSGLDVPGSAV